MPDQAAHDCHNITARVFRQKIKSLIDFITKHHVFGETSYWSKNVYAHILIWLIEKIKSEKIDNIISAEIPDPEIDPELFEIATTNMIHSPSDEIRPV